MEKALRVCLLVLLLAVAPGCALKGGEATARGGSPAADAWLPRPVSMRVYPSTRFVRHEAEALLEARVELLDEMGDSTKGGGEFRLELFGPAGLGSQQSGRRLYAWRVPVMTLADQRLFYDAITRSYLLRLKLDDAVLTQPAALLRVAFTPVNGDRLETEANLQPDAGN